MKTIACLLLATAWIAPLPGQQSADRRRHDLEVLQKNLLPSRTNFDGRINAQDKSWEDWVKRTGELPPDFASMASIPELPDPLMFEGKVPVKTPADWARQKQWMREQIQHWMFGKLPPKPDNLRAVVTGTHMEGRVTVRDVRLEFGPGHRAT